MLKNSKGNAIIEIIPILAVFVLILNFSLGFFGLIHSGILNSIAARNYAFETFRNRADLRYLRDIPGVEVNLSFTYTKSQVRFHVIKKEGSTAENKYEATRRPVKFSDVGGVAEEKGIVEHNKYRAIMEGQRASEAGAEEGANPAWVKTGYGMCLVATCGG
jgi:hypothetical protein